MIPSNVQADSSYKLGKIGGSLEKKIQSGAKKFYIALNCGEKCFFVIQKANLVNIQSIRFRGYSFVFERTQSRLDSIYFCFSHLDVRTLLVYS